MDQIQEVRKSRRALRRRSSEGLCQYLLSALSGLVLGGASFRGQALPLGVCLISAQSPGGRALGAAIGAVGGYFLRCEPAEAVEYTAVSLLMLLTLFLFQGTILWGRKGFLPLCSGALCGLMGAVGLLGSPEARILPWLGKALLGAAGTEIFRKAMGGHRSARVILAGALVLGLSGRGTYIDPGLMGAVAVACVTGELLPGAAMGAALELGGNTGSSMTLIMVMPAVLCKLLRVKRRGPYALIYGVLPGGLLMLLGEGTPAQYLAIALGAVTGYLISRSPLLTPAVTTSEERDTGKCQEQAAVILEALGEKLPNGPDSPGEEAERIFDTVGERVCRDCAFFHRCWKMKGQETCGALSAAAPRIIERGIAREEDFPKEFRERCCAFGVFLPAVNRELEGMLYRRRYYRSLQENRRIIEEEYRLLAQFLRQSGKKRRREAERRYNPLVSICSARKSGERVCGDRGVCFMAPDNCYYVILCDGMGTGEEAARLSSYAVRLLEKLLRAGLSPEGAMSLLNGNMVLRGSGTFSTVDLLKLDLYRGTAEIYKWGAAPSFWREGDRVRVFGNPTPPPGVGIGNEGLPEIFRLPMGEGQLLVMISDGAYCQETEAAIGACRASSPGELAALLIGNLEAEDDMTAIVVSLRHRGA